MKRWYNRFLELIGVRKSLPKVLIPMIKATFPEITASDIIGVQPMTGPSDYKIPVEFGVMCNNGKFRKIK